MSQKIKRVVKVQFIWHDEGRNIDDTMYYGNITLDAFRKLLGEAQKLWQSSLESESVPEAITAMDELWDFANEHGLSWNDLRTALFFLDKNGTLMPVIQQCKGSVLGDEETNNGGDQKQLGKGEAVAQD